jgi:hypothetical protein
MTLSAYTSAAPPHSPNRTKSSRINAQEWALFGGGTVRRGAVAGGFSPLRGRAVFHLVSLGECADLSCAAADGGGEQEDITSCLRPSSPKGDRRTPRSTLLQSRHALPCCWEHSFSQRPCEGNRSSLPTPSFGSGRQRRTLPDDPGSAGVHGELGGSALAQSAKGCRRSGSCHEPLHACREWRRGASPDPTPVSPTLILHLCNRRSGPLDFLCANGDFMKRR